MKTCDYCKREHEETVEECCGFSAFTAVSVEEKEEVEVAEVNIEECVQPAAHELLKELVSHVDLDALEVIEPLPEWISNIPYEDVKASAEAKYLEEHPGLVTRIKKYLEM